VSPNGRDRPARSAFKVGTRVGGENDCENSAKESSDIRQVHAQGEWLKTEYTEYCSRRVAVCKSG
jgi:hypothetical protein